VFDGRWMLWLMRRGRLPIIFGVVLALSGFAHANKRVRLPTMDDLATTWVGATAFGEYLRLELDKTGTGVLAIQYLRDKPARGYRIRQTTLAKYRVVFQVEAAEVSAEPVFLRGDAYPGALELELGGTSVDWKRKVVLEPLPDLVRRLAAVETAAGQVRKGR
jgi:hypothetical protein